MEMSDTQKDSADWKQFTKVLKKDLKQYNKNGVKDDAIAARIKNSWHSWLARPDTSVRKRTKAQANAMAGLIVKGNGPTDILYELLSPKFDVNPEIATTQMDTLLFMSIKNVNVPHIMTLLHWNADVTTVHLPSNEGECRNALTWALRMPTGRWFDQDANIEVDRTLYVVERLLAKGATLRTLSHRNKFEIEVVMRAIAECGNPEVARLILQSSAADLRKPIFDARHIHDYESTRVDRNGVVHKTHQIERKLSVLQAVRQRDVVSADNSVTKACDHVYSDGPCRRRNCNLAMIKMFIANGANPLHEGHTLGPQWAEIPVALDLCDNAKVELCTFMYERARDTRIYWSYVLQRAFNKDKNRNARSFPTDVLQLIIGKHAGIGAIFFADKNTPWIPIMLPRQTEPGSTWHNAYTAVDRQIKMSKAV
jgi:hypothetical protein